MKKTYKRILIPLIIIIILAAYGFNLRNLENTDVISIAVIIRGHQNGYWDTVKQGIDKAANDMKADVSFVTLLEENSEAEQLAAIKRELANSAQAVIIAPVSKEVMETAKGISGGAVLIEMESSGSENATASVSTKNAEMGRSIARQVLKTYREGQKIVVVKPEICAPTIIEREIGFREVLDDNGMDFEYWVTPVYTQQAIDYIKSKVVLEGTDIAVAFGFSDLYNLSKAAGGVQISNAKLFGADSTNEIVSMIEGKTIESTVAPNAFNLGYLSVKTAVDAVKGKKIKKNIFVDHSVIYLDNIYTPENQRLLFPFIR